MQPNEAGTTVNYLYRDAGNYKFRGSFVVSGEMSLERLKPHLFDGTFFIPELVGVRRLVPECQNDDDHELHEFEEFEPCTASDASCTADELVRRFATVNDLGWFNCLGSTGYLRMRPNDKKSG